MQCKSVGQVNKMIEHGCKSDKKILFEPGEFRGIRDNIKPAEVPQFLGVFRNTISRDVVGIEKISCNNRALSIG